MPPSVTLLASGLKLLSFQGVTVFENAVFVATIEANLVRVATDGTLTTWVNVARYGIPTGMVGVKQGLIVALSAQESGHFLMQVSPLGRVSPLANLSELAGEFGAPFGVTAHEGYYPYYLVAISTDVVGSGGLIARVTQSGKISVLATLPSTPFGVGLGDDYVLATQENGAVLRISFAGEIQAIANLRQAQLGMPLDITHFQGNWILTTSTGWLVRLTPQGTLTPLLQLAEWGQGLPTTLTTFQDRLIVATQAGNLLQVRLSSDD